MTDRAALLDYADEVLDRSVALGARGPRTAAVLARLAFEDWLSRACHHHAYELQPSATEVRGLVAAVRDLDAG